MQDSDYRSDEKPKVIRNAAADVVGALDERGGSQRGKPRSRNPDGGRVYDINCHWPMYRAPYKDTFRYVCGSYVQTQGKTCNYNHVDGMIASQFVLRALQQKLLGLKDLAGRLREIAMRDMHDAESHDHLRDKQRALAQVTTQLKTVRF